MMRRRDGYVLAYVMVVLLVIGMVAVSASSVIVSNFKSQTSTVRDMQERYELEGQTEQFVANVEDIIRQKKTYAFTEIKADKFWEELYADVPGDESVPDSEKYKFRSWEKTPELLPTVDDTVGVKLTVKTAGDDASRVEAEYLVTFDIANGLHMVQPAEISCISYRVILVPSEEGGGT